MVNLSYRLCSIYVPVVNTILFAFYPNLGVFVSAAFLKIHFLMYPVLRNAIDVFSTKTACCSRLFLCVVYTIAIHRLCFWWPQHKLSITVTDTVGETPPHTDTSKAPRFNTNKKHKSIISPKPVRSKKHWKWKGRKWIKHTTEAWGRECWYNFTPP